MHLEVGTLRTQVHDAQAVPLSREATTSLVDTRLLGKPVFRRRRRLEVIRSNACACSAPLGLLLERTERSARPMLNVTLTQSEASLSTQHNYKLVMLCKGTALTRVVNAGAQEALEAWRAFGPASRTDLDDTQCESVARALDFSFEGETPARMAIAIPVQSTGSEDRTLGTRTTNAHFSRVLSHVTVTHHFTDACDVGPSFMNELSIHLRAP